MKRVSLPLAAFLAASTVSPSAVGTGFWDPNIYSGAMRTEYASDEGTSNNFLTLWYVNNGLPGDEGCLFDEEVTFSGCPGRAGLPDGTDGLPVWSGSLQAYEGCAKNPSNGDDDRNGDSWRGCLRYDGGTYSAFNNPGSNYWMIHANNDPSFDQCNQGPPGASGPVVDFFGTGGGLYKVGLDTQSSGKQRVNIMINENQSNDYCADSGEYIGNLAFLSVGAQDTSGNGGDIAEIGRHSSYDIDDVLNFRARIHHDIGFECDAADGTECDSANYGVHAGVFIMAEWSGVPRYVAIELYANGAGNFTEYEDGYIETKWNWPIYESGFWPGARYVSVGHDAQFLSNCPGVNIPGISPGDPAETYSIDIGDLFRCLETEKNSFAGDLPLSGIEITGVHWFAESSGDTGRMRWWFEDAHMTSN